MAEVVVLEHTRGAGVSAFAEVLDTRSDAAPWRVVDVPAGDELPTSLDDVVGVLAMGGTMSAVDPTVHAWMPPELDLLRAAVEAEVPVLGVCLGAQLLGQALGGEVRTREVPEIGYLPLERADEGHRDAVVKGWPDGAATLFLHEDEVTRLPDGAVTLLTGSDGTAAWRVGSAVAVQFHPEVTPEQLTSWVERGLLTDLFTRAGVDGAALVEEAQRRGPVVVPQGRALIGRWLDGPVRRHLEVRG